MTATRALISWLIVFGSWMLPVSAYAVKKNLKYSNLPKETQTELTKRFPQIEKDKVGLDQIDDVIRYLQLKPQFSNIRVLDDGNGTPYRLEFQRTRRIATIKFSGNFNLTDSDAQNVFSVKTGDVFDQQTLIEGGERIRQVYKDRGYLNAVIDIEMPPEGEDQVGVIVKVTENKLTRIHNVYLQSPNADLNQKLAKALVSFLNDPYTDSTLSEIHKKARAYLTKNRYIRTDLNGPKTEFSTDESEVTLSYTLDKTENYIFDYQGIRFLAIRDIENELDLDNFYSGNPSVGTELAQKIRNFYLARGYARAEVKADETEGANSYQRKITFNINEGPLVKIQSINVTGRFSRKEGHYVRLIKEHSSKLVEDDYYNKEDIDTGLKNLILELQNSGFLQAKVLSSRTQYNRDKDAVTIYVNLDEGPLTEIQSIEFIGNQEFTKERLLEVTRLQPGPLRLKQIENAINRLKDFYHENGYIEMLLLNEKEDLVSYDETNTKASLRFKILEGPQVRAASIIIEGNDFTKDYVILKELEFQQGDLITPSKVDESIARLQRTGFFGSVEIRTLEEKTNVANRTVLVKVSEREPGVFTIGAGATSERKLTLRGYTGVSYRNLMGTGRGISMRLEGNYNVADIKYLGYRIIFGYLEPYIFDTRIRGRVNVSRTSTVMDYDNRRVWDINSTTYSLEKDFTSHILGIWDIWSLANIEKYSIDKANHPFVSTSQNIATTGPTVDLDFRDNPFNPTTGTFTRWSAEYSSPVIGSTNDPDFSIEYWKTTLSFTKYWNIARFQKQPVVWANQVRGGYLKNLSQKDKGGVPWDSVGFTLGGQSTIRGYEAGTQEVFPNLQDLGVSKDQSYYLLTESTMYLIKSELRFAVYGNIGGALFYDGGSVKIRGLDFKDDYRDSAGFGIRYNTPVGPLSVDFAWKLDARPSEEPWRFHLSIGTF